MPAPARSQANTTAGAMDRKSSPPPVADVSVGADFSREVELDLEFQLAGNPDISLEAKAGIVGVEAKLAKLKFGGIIRLRLKVFHCLSADLLSVVIVCWFGSPSFPSGPRSALFPSASQSGRKSILHCKRPR